MKDYLSRGPTTIKEWCQVGAGGPGDCPTLGWPATGKISNSRGALKGTIKLTIPVKNGHPYGSHDLISRKAYSSIQTQTFKFLLVESQILRLSPTKTHSFSFVSYKNSNMFSEPSGNQSLLYGLRVAGPPMGRVPLPTGKILAPRKV